VGGLGLFCVVTLSISVDHLQQCQQEPSALQQMEQPQQQQQQQVAIIDSPNNNINLTSIINGEYDLHKPNPKTYQTDSEGATNSKCRLMTRPVHHHAKIRFIVFQRDSAEQLHDFITYYKRAVPLDSLVIIDHLGQDEWTQGILDHYSAYGMHVWRCTGGFKWKDRIWSSVIRLYKNSSDFLMPLDVDEFMAVKQTTTSADGKEAINLTWNKSALEAELDMLLQQYDGRPYKTTWTDPISQDCPNKKTKKSKRDSSVDKRYTPVKSFHTKFCGVKEGVEKKERRCTAKTMTRGVAYISTDTGNHHGVTSELSKVEHYHRCNAHIENPTNVSSPYIFTNLSLVHMQDLTYHDWLIHNIRGVSNKRLNKFGEELSRTACFGDGTEYCKTWKMMAEEDFHYWDMKDIFYSKKCTFRKSNRIVSTKDLFRPICYGTNYL
jgi:hypothetical protein